MTRRLHIPALTVGLLSMLHLASAGPYAGFTTTAQIPWKEDSGSGVDWSTNVHVKLRLTSTTARSYEPIVDTGTTGIVFSASEMSDWNPATEAVPSARGWEFLSSSDVLYAGYWVRRDIFFNVGDSSRPVIKANVLMLAMTEKTVCPNYNTTTDTDTCPGVAPALMPNGTRMMGIGFGREIDGQPQGTPDKNPLLNIVSIGSQSMPAYYKGYIIDKRGITVGLTDANMNGMSLIELPARNPVGGSGRVPTLPFDWDAVPACISVNGANCSTGTALLDTGIDQSYLRMPIGVSLPRDTTNTYLIDGSEVRIDFGTSTAAIETFTVGTGITTGVTPAYVRASNTRRPTFINTGRHAYRGFVTGFDAIAGRYGMKSI